MLNRLAARSREYRLVGEKCVQLFGGVSCHLCRVSADDKMAEKCMMALWVEVRCRAAYYLGQALRKSNYNCDINGVETDRLVVQLNKVANWLLRSLHHACSAFSLMM